MKKLIAWLENSFAPKMNKINHNVWIVTLKDSVMQILPFILLGSLFCVGAVLENYVELSFSFWTPFRWTMGMVSVLVAFLIPFNFCEKKRLRKQRLIAGGSGLILFLIAITPEVIAEGSPGFGSSALGAGGMFCSIVTGIIVCIVFNLFGKFSFFKEDSAIPDFVRQWFDALLPIFIVIFGGFIAVFSSIQLNSNILAHSNDRGKEHEFINFHSKTNIEFEDMSEELFWELDDSEMVLEMPRGGYIYGPGTFEVYDLDGNLIETYDIETDPNSMTVAKAKEKEENKETLPQITPYGANYPAWDKVMNLAPEQGYQSNSFSGQGWRYSGYKFVPQSETGMYLRWSTYLDDGRVALEPSGGWPLEFVFDPNIHSNPLYRGSYQHFGGGWEGSAFGYSKQIYCTYNPVAGSYYIVENKN